MTVKHVVMFSGGAGSWYAAKRVAHLKPTLLFADTKVESPDLYDFIQLAAADLDCELVVVADGRTPFEVFKDKRFLGNSRIASCSEYLKQKPCAKWIDENCDPDSTTLYIGIDWSEIHRLPAVERGWAPFKIVAPLCERPYLSKDDVLAELRAAGLPVPVAYTEGFPHNNCMEQGCVRGGQAYWRHLLRMRPEVFRATEEREREMGEFLGRPVTMLKETVDGDVRGLSLAQLRERVETQPELLDGLEWGGCGCFVSEDDS